MAYLSATQGASGVVSILIGAITAPFRAFGRLIVRLAELDTRYKMVEHLNGMSDAELEARGTTRVAEVKRLFASSGVV